MILSVLGMSFIECRGRVEHTEEVTAHGHLHFPMPAIKAEAAHSSAIKRRSQPFDQGKEKWAGGGGGSSCHINKSTKCLSGH